MPYGVDEYGLAGALNGAAIDVVQAETFDALVPAHAEIVLEGIIRTDVLEPEAPFGEASGYLGPRKMEKIFEVRAVTQRARPIYQGIISEFPPSESTVIRKASFDAIYLKHLRDACNIPSVKKVASYEMASCNMMFVIQLMQKALTRWKELSLPALDLKTPWHGYPLSEWTEENATEAELAVTGRYFDTGNKLAKRREET